MDPFRLVGQRGRVALFALTCLLAACASTEAKWSPGQLDQARIEKCRLAERAYREETPDYPGLRDDLAKDPVAASWFVRMLIRDLFTVREGRPVSSDDLLRAAAKIENPVEARAIAEIAAFGSAAVPTLVNDLLRHSQPQPRELGIELLAQVGRPALPALREMAKDSEPRHRRAAARALAAVGVDAEVFATLAELAADPEFTVRADALRGLREGGGAAAAELLRRRLREDPDPFVRRQAAQSLASYAEVESANAINDYLQRCQRELDPRGEETAQDSLRALAGTKQVRTLAAWKKWASTWQPQPK
jgi:HEAT repeat protein